MANTGFKIGGRDLSSIYLTKEDFDTVYPQISNSLKNGKSVVWGYSDVHGALGTGVGARSTSWAFTHTTDISDPTYLAGNEAGWRQLSYRNGTTAGIKDDGTLWTWGDNNLGRLGDNTYISSNSPTQTYYGGNNWKQVSIGNTHVGAVKTDGSLWVWGRNDYGQFGMAVIISGYSAVPISSSNVLFQDVTQVSCGSEMTAIIRQGGGLYTTGRNVGWQLGIGATVGNSAAYESASFEAFRPIGINTTWKQVTARGELACAAIDSSGGLHTWGLNNRLQMGQAYYFNANTALAQNQAWKSPTPVTTPSSTAVWKQVALYQDSAVGLLANGQLYTWGSGEDGFTNIGAGNLGLSELDFRGRSTPVAMYAGGARWRKLCVESECQAAILDNGQMATWGAATKWHYTGVSTDKLTMYPLWQAYNNRSSGSFSNGYTSSPGAKHFKDAIVFGRNLLSYKTGTYTSSSITPGGFIGIYDNTFIDPSDSNGGSYEAYVNYYSNPQIFYFSGGGGVGG